MDYIDTEYVAAVIASGKVVFTRSEVDRAEAEMRGKGALVSSVGRHGIHIGLMPDVASADAEMRACGATTPAIDRLVAYWREQLPGAGEPRETSYFSAYAKGFWIGPLTVSPDMERNAAQALSLPAWILDAIGTDYEDEARRLAGWIAAYHFEPDEIVCARLDPAIDALRRKLEPLGRIGADKKSLHLTDASMAALKAGGTMSSRVNAIIARYEAVTRNPALAADIAAIEALEREIQRDKPPGVS